MTEPTKRESIVIIGGGMSALTAAFELTSLPEWQRRYDITLYQMGHRLGGKGASGRNHKRFDRIFSGDVVRSHSAAISGSTRPPRSPMTVGDHLDPTAAATGIRRRRSPAA